MLTRPALHRLALTDSAAFSALIIPPTVWVLYAGMLVFDRSRAEEWFFPLLPIAITLVCAGVVVWRVLLISGVFARGVEVTGRVTHVSPARAGSIRIEFDYSDGEHDHSGRNSINDSRYAQEFQRGDEVVLVLDPARPHVAFIRDLYL
jgi:hypothetical protein